MNDIRPPRRPQSPRPTVSSQPPTLPTPVVQPQQSAAPLVVPEELPSITEPSPLPKKSYKKLIISLILGFIGLILLVVGGAVAWYYSMLVPVSSGDKNHVRVSIVSGDTPAVIAGRLHEKGLIKSTLAFDIYTRLSGARNKLQAGAYSLSPSESLEGIVNHLVSGKTDQMTITFYPGATLRDKSNKPEKQKTDVETILLRAGYSQEEIDAALSKTYDHPLFVDKPAGTDLEGYVYGETYAFGSDATVEQILTHTFDIYWQKIQEGDLVNGLKRQNLNLYQGVTLASVVQREVSQKDDMKQVAQVFLKRLSIDMMLGSDVTYQYAADKLGVPRDTNLDSPYNTRRFNGLPPGPIATPGIAALQAVAEPAAGDYLFFLSGDDDVTYFATTDAEHEANIRDHCQVKCSTL